MSSFRVRPRFTQIVDLDIATVQEKIVNHITQSQSQGRCEVKNFAGYISLRIPEKDQHFWSPQLTLSLYPAEKDKTRIQGIYGPNTNVWSLFLYGYLLAGSLGTFAGIFGFCQWMIGTKPWGLWILGGMIAVAVALYLTAQLGQKLGAWQTFLLHQAYESAIGHAAEIH